MTIGNRGPPVTAQQTGSFVFVAPSLGSYVRSCFHRRLTLQNWPLSLLQMLPYALLIGKVKREPNHSNLTVTKIFKDKWQAVASC